MSEPLEDSFDLKDFLEEADLEQYYALFRDILKVRKVSQLKFVDGKDLTQIGLSKPEQRQYKKVYDKYFPNICVMKLRKILRPYRKNANLPRTCKQPTAQLPYDRSSSGISIKHIIPMNDLIISNELGAGEFGIVQQGTWTTGCENVQVAIKCLGPEKMASDSGDFWKEAAVMHNVDHPNIIRLYGVVLNMDSLMLVTELAPYRSLLLCLRESTSRTDFPVATLCCFAEQICDGMTYLESKRLLHRDLATRNILVFSRHKVKISDFGLSRALAIDKDYYQTKYNVDLRLPIAWCAPECILYLRFTSGSDVWAYGVCLWEMFSYGCQPWAGFSAKRILQSIDIPSLQRLQRPLHCPVAYYNIMLKCWEHDTNARPKFKEIGPKLRQICPQQVQALLNYSNVDSRRHNLLEYTAGDIITVIGKDDLWYGVANNGRSGYFHPLNTTLYNIPKVASFSHHDSASTPECLSSLTGESSSNPSLSRSDLKRHTYTDKRTVQRSMISSPQGFVKHTGHIGLDGACFGDISFLDPASCVMPKYAARSYRPEDLEHVPLINSNSKSRMTCGASSCASYPTLQDGARPTNYKCTGAIPKNSGTVGSGKGGKKKSSTAPTATKSLLERVKSATFGTSFTSSHESWPSTSMMEEEHHYEEIIEKRDDDLKECTMEDIETVFRGLDVAGRRNNSLFNKKFPQHDVPTRAHTLGKTEKKKVLNTSTMKPMSAHDEKTLDTAVALANELTARSMTDLEINSHKQRNSPSERSKFNFKFPGRLGSLGHSHEPQKCAAPKQGRKNFSEQAKGVPDIQATLTEESKFAYTSLIEEPALSRMQEDLGANDFPQQNSFQNKHLRSRRVTHPVTHHSNSESISRSTTNHKRTNEHCRPEQANVVPLPPRSAETRLVDKPRHTRKYPLVFPSTGHQYPSVNEQSVIPCNSYEKPIVKSLKSPRIYQNLNTSQRFEEAQMLDRPCCSRKFYQNIDIIRSVDVMDGPSALEKLSSKSKHETDNNADICSNNPFTYVCQENARSANPFTPPEEKASTSSFNDEKNASRKSSSSNLQEFDHVSLEDLLEFANLKPCGRQRGIESDEVRIMRKVLKEEVTPEACLQALELTDWDVHKAIKMLMSPPRSST